MPVPLIDLAAEPPQAQARRIDAALREQGFFAVIGHGVPPAVVAGAFEASRRFFALPQAVKERWHIDGWPHEEAHGRPRLPHSPSGGLTRSGRLGGGVKRGFDPIGWQSLDPGQPPDVKESFYLGVESIGPNQWPDESLLPGFRAACNTYSAALDGLERRLMALFETALELHTGYFDSFMRHPTITTRLLHYPPQPAQAAPGQIGCGAHTDWGALTLLAQDDAGGLQVKTPQGEWIDATPIPGSFVVNVGDMAQRWTNDRWRSTLHRVINKYSGRDRYSIAYFFDLDAQSRIEPLPSCVSEEHPARYAPITAGEHLVEMYRRTTVHA
jgi:isopenicillin N synthase-like dioxygenase